ncbi:MAG: helix-turn-helix domain-containing protein [Chitinophagaceae bacterium]|nr:helix-turn-helix domain-containing protein [Chitinophagaceae bacterium]
MPAERIKHFRKLKGFTQENFSIETGLSQSQISKYENGSHIPSAQILKIFAQALNVEAFEFLYKNQLELDEAINRYLERGKKQL